MRSTYSRGNCSALKVSRTRAQSGANFFQTAAEHNFIVGFSFSAVPASFYDPCLRSLLILSTIPFDPPYDPWLRSLATIPGYDPWLRSLATIPAYDPALAGKQRASIGEITFTIPSHDPALAGKPRALVGQITCTIPNYDAALAGKPRAPIGQITALLGRCVLRSVLKAQPQVDLRRCSTP